LQYQLDNYEAGEDPHKKMNVLEALRWAIEAWREDVTETTIVNCWLKSRVLKGQMMPPTKWQAQQMGWQEAVKRDEDSYDHVVNLARQAIKELEKRQFIKEGQNVAIFLDPQDEIIEDDPEDDGFIEQITQAYARVPDIDPDGPEVPLPEFISIPQALGAVDTLRTFAEQQKEDYTVLLRQLRALEREMKALQVVNSTQTTLERFFVAK
jgi:hypothetical protein